MAAKKWTVVIEWESDLCEDADELAVFSASAAGATSAARAAWVSANRKELESGNIRLGKVFALTPERILEFA